MQIVIHQIVLSDEEIDQVNAGQSVPKYDAKMSAIFGKYKSDNTVFYSPTFAVEARDLEHAYEITNLWKNPELVEPILEGGYSSSVGDIFQIDEKFYMVDVFGFKEVWV